MKKVIDGLLVVGGICLILSIVFMAESTKSLTKENAMLREQNSSLGEKSETLCFESARLKSILEQTRKNASDPTIHISDLPDGNYLLTEDKHYGFVQCESVDGLPGVRGPHLPVYCPSRKIPDRFSVKDIRKEVADFLQNK